MPRRVTTELRRIARDAFGWDSLRLGQLEAMQSVMAGRDTLVVMPTGAGKSACYQIPALMLDGPTVVVSPLIALQRDQVLDLLAHGAFAANSAQPGGVVEEGWAAVAAGEVEFVFLSPEQLAKPDVVSRLEAVRPSLFVVDEAHCVSAWGHDFRPDYLRVGSVIDQLGHPVTLALTATASPPVREEIVSRLNMREPLQLVSGFDRPNLRLEVVPARSADHKVEAVVLRAAAEAKPGIVYAATRKDAEAYAAALTEIGLRACCYHAGMRAGDRNEVHSLFLDDRVDVVVATTAFGMGIDKPNVRFVLHADVPDSLDSYYQEIGRAGRDGQPASGVLYYRQEDLGLRRFFTSGNADEVVLERVAKLVAMHGAPVPVPELRAAAQLSSTRLTHVLNLLEEVGAVAVVDATVRPAEVAPAPHDAAQAALAVAEARTRVEISRVEMVRGYAETTGCRRHYLLAYFGEVLDRACGNCDTCAAGATEIETGGAWRVNDRVAHEQWGPGIVMRCEPDRVTVLFELAGYKTLKLDAVRAA